MSTSRALVTAPTVIDTSHRHFRAIGYNRPDRGRVAVEAHGAFDGDDPEAHFRKWMLPSTPTVEGHVPTGRPNPVYRLRRMFEALMERFPDPEVYAALIGMTGELASVLYCRVQRLSVPMGRKDPKHALAAYAIEHGEAMSKFALACSEDSDGGRRITRREWHEDGGLRAELMEARDEIDEAIALGDARYGRAA